MGLRNTEESWGWLSRLLHWTGAGVVLFMLALGFWMANFVQSMITQLEWTQVHKSWGFVAFVLVLIRIVWRLINPTPTLPRHMGPFERGLAHGGHLALYALMIAMPLTGWLLASSSPLNDEGAYPMRIPNMVFGLFELPDPYPKGDKALSETFGAIHFYCGIVLSVVVVGHVLAAIKHQAGDRDGLITRMITGRSH